MYIKDYQHKKFKKANMVYLMDSPEDDAATAELEEAQLEEIQKETLPEDPQKKVEEAAKRAEEKVLGAIERKLAATEVEIPSTTLAIKMISPDEIHQENFEHPNEEIKKCLEYLKKITPEPKINIFLEGLKEPNILLNSPDLNSSSFEDKTKAIKTYVAQRIAGPLAIDENLKDSTPDLCSITSILPSKKNGESIEPARITFKVEKKDGSNLSIITEYKVTGPLGEAGYFYLQPIIDGEGINRETPNKARFDGSLEGLRKTLRTMQFTNKMAN